MPTSHVFYHRSPAHGNAYVLSFAFCFDKEDENYQFAMCQPFTYSRHKVGDLLLHISPLLPLTSSHKKKELNVKFSV